MKLLIEMMMTVKGVCFQTIALGKNSSFFDLHREVIFNATYFEDHTLAVIVREKEREKER